MTTAVQPYRLATRGLVDRSIPLPFTFDRAPMEGFEGDTLASALLANGVRMVSRSFKYHRPRGIFGSGFEEPNALVTVGSDGHLTPNMRATEVWLRAGLTARSQNRWPSLRWDLGAMNGVLGPMLAAGFYYKTFMRPRALWPLYERLIRRMAGMGRAPRLPDPDRYDKQYHHCDYLIVGLGPAGLAAALAASRSPDLRVIALDADRLAGGALLFNRARVDGLEGLDWAARAAVTLSSRPGVRMLLRTVAFGYYDDNLVAAVENRSGLEAENVRERIHWIRADRIILATGSHERPLVYPDNDRPGILLASAARSYLNRYAVAPGRRVAILTNNDSAYPLARDLTEAGVGVAAVIDVRRDVSVASDLPQLSGHTVTATYGKRRLSGIRVAPSEASAVSARDIICDALCVSGGWSPAVQLHAQAQGVLRFDDTLGAPVPGPARQGHLSVGAAAGVLSTDAALRQGWNSGGGQSDGPRSDDVDQPTSTEPLAGLSEPVHGKAFVDLQNDVIASDIHLAAREGFDSVEHLKRYTTLGMGTDQGKTSNLNGAGLLASATGRSVASLGLTTFRPPYVPVTLGALAGHHQGKSFTPIRHSPLHEKHLAAGALFVNVGLWQRPRCYPRDVESLREAVNREVRTVRSAVGMVDITTLGKIDLQGPDCSELLERVYCNRWQSLEVGKLRYGLMLREDGIVLDDGTTSRLGPEHYFMTTSTGHADAVLRHLEYCLQVLWPDLKVHLTSVTEQWCAIAIAGPDSRNALSRALEFELGGESLPHLGVRTIRFAHARAYVLRVSFSGELAYEIYVPSRLGPHLWDRLLAAGTAFGLAPYGTDALTVLRVEKGHVAGPEIDGRTTPADLGMARLRSTRTNYIGRRLGEREALQDSERAALVGVLPLDRSSSLRAGAQLLMSRGGKNSLGHVTSAVHSATLGHSIGLGLLCGGARRKGERLVAYDAFSDECVHVEIVDPVFVDPDGGRLRG